MLASDLVDCSVLNSSLSPQPLIVLLSCCNFELPSVSDNQLEDHHTAVIVHQMAASDLLMGLCSLSPQSRLLHLAWDIASPDACLM